MTPDEQLLSDDWIKGGTWDLPTDWPTLFWTVLEADDERVANLLTLPAAAAMPADLRATIEAHLALPSGLREAPPYDDVKPLGQDR